jgi:hypothetical protein
MNNFFRNYFQTIVNPSKAFKNVLTGNYFKNGFLYMLIPAIGYQIMYILLKLGNGAPSTFTPWLNISKENYYYYNQFLIVPSLLLSWFFASAVMQVLARCMNGTGTFEQTLALTGLSVSVAMWATLFHDLAMSFCSAAGFINAAQHEIAMNTPTIWRTILWICFAVYFFAFLVLFYKTVRAVHQLNGIRSFIIGTIGFILFQIVFLVFNR